MKKKKRLNYNQKQKIRQEIEKYSIIFFILAIVAGIVTVIAHYSLQNLLKYYALLTTILLFIIYTIYKFLKPIYYDSKDKKSILANKTVLFLWLGFCLLFSINYILDLPYALNKKYKIMQGVCSKVFVEKINKSGKWCDRGTDVYYINGKRLSDSASRYYKNLIIGRYYIILYLPHTETVIDIKEI